MRNAAASNPLLLVEFRKLVLSWSSHLASGLAALLG
jgi:hypothetical protein